MKPKKDILFKEMQYVIGEGTEGKVRVSLGCFTFPLFGVPVQISGHGLIAVRRFLKFENRATRHARKLTKALNAAAEAARNASVYFYVSDIPQAFGQKNEPTQEPAHCEANRD